MEHISGNFCLASTRKKPQCFITEEQISADVLNSWHMKNPIFKKLLHMFFFCPIKKENCFAYA